MSSKWENLKEKANDAFKKKDYKAALSLYSDSIKLDPNQDSSYSNRGLCHMTIGRYSQAISDLNKAVLLNSKNIKALKRLAQVHLVLGELSEAELYLKRCVEVELNEESHKVDVKIVRDLIISNEELNKAKFIYDYKKCEPLAQKLVSKCTEANHIKLIYLECLIQNCKPQEALTFFKEKINLEDSRKPEYQYLLCQAYYQDGKYEKAKQILSQLISLSKENNLEKYTKLWDNLKQIETEKEKANDSFKKGDYDGAILLYTKLLDLDTNNKIFNSTILANRALCYQKKNKLFDALTDINNSLTLNPNYWKAYYRRATINLTLKNISKSKEDLNKVLELDSNNKDAVLLLEDIKHEEKKHQKRNFYKILDASPDASYEDIRKFYRKLASKWHPDKNTETQEQREHAEKMYKDIVEAYNILSDPKKRKIYDEGGHPDDPNSAFHTQNQSDTFDEIVKQASSNYQQNEAKDFKDEKPKNEKNNRNNSGYKGKTTHSKGKKPRHYDNRYK